MANPSGITIINVDKHDKTITQFLRVIDTETGDTLRDPDFPEHPIIAFEINLVEGWVIHAARNSSGDLETLDDEWRRKKTHNHKLRLDWSPDAPDWIVQRYTGATLEDIEPEEPA